MHNHTKINTFSIRNDLRTTLNDVKAYTPNITHLDSIKSHWINNKTIPKFKKTYQHNKTKAHTLSKGANA